MMKNKNVLKNDMLILANNFHKIIEVNLAEDTYYVVKIAENEKVKYKSVMLWAQEVVKAGLIHADDVRDFLDFFASFGNIQKFQERQIFYYKRLMEGNWRTVCTEVVPMPHFTVEDPIVLILVRDVTDYIEAYTMQNGDNK